VIVRIITYEKAHPCGQLVLRTTENDAKLLVSSTMLAARAAADPSEPRGPRITNSALESAFRI
jgi:hypothetical protein